MGTRVAVSKASAVRNSRRGAKPLPLNEAIERRRIASRDQCAHGSRQHQINAEQQQFLVTVRRRWWIQRCGAVTRKGKPCLAMPVLNEDGRPRNGRCKQHAGCSTGPKTPEGKARCTAGRIRLYDQRKAAGLPAIVRKPKTAPAATATSETPQAKRVRIIQELRAR